MTIQTNTNTNSSDVAILAMASLVPFTLGNSRITHNKAKRDQLRDSIKAKGIITPITVRPSPTVDGQYEVVAGFGRWESAVELNFETAPALIKSMTDSEAFEIQLTENMVRNDLNLVDECKAAQKFISLSEGDHTEASKRLGWTDKKLKDRLQLLRCTDEVLNALNENKIKIGHAILLSSFSEKLQQGTLAKVVAESWSVEYLKERSGKAKKYLHVAKFDTSEKSDCSTCQHNTLPQNDMFGTGLKDKAMCSNLVCWKGKTNDWLKVQRDIAIEKYGKTLLFIESNEQDRNTVSESKVGAEQFKSCLSCESNCAIIDDRDGREGDLIESQCLDVVCFSKCEKTHQKSLQTPVKKEVKPSGVSASSAKANKENVEKTLESKPVVEQKTPASVTKRERDLLRDASAIALKDDQLLKQSLMLALLTELSGKEPEFMGKSYSFNAKVLKGLTLDPALLQTSIMSGLAHYMDQSSREDSKNPIDLLIDVISTKDIANSVAVNAWFADKETLTNYTISGITVLCQESGFSKAYEENESNLNKKLTFAKLLKSGKGDLIKKIIAFNYDWSAYAPATMLKHIKK
jgi:PRTRC genetic system ParB family protein